MKSDTKTYYPFLYFEMYSVQSENEEKKVLPTLQNVNGLIFPPHTNSDGYWGYSNLTIRPATLMKDVSYVNVDQYWVDLEKYVQPESAENYRLIDKLIAKCIDKFEATNIIFR